LRRSEPMKLHLKKTSIQAGIPFWQLADLFSGEPCGALLDSGMDPEKLGNFSFLAGRPTALLTARRIAEKSDSGRVFLLDLVRFRFIGQN